MDSPSVCVYYFHGLSENTFSVRDKMNRPKTVVQKVSHYPGVNSGEKDYQASALSTGLPAHMEYSSKGHSSGLPGNIDRFQRSKIKIVQFLKTVSRPTHRPQQPCQLRFSESLGIFAHAPCE